ncbi:hypothetical protein EON66_00230 [archaeon]|nr:MAG: hypothetical protein EON66_00230 [archaeon]
MTTRYCASMCVCARARACCADVLQEDIDAMEDHKALLITKAAAAGVDDLPAFSASLSSVQTTDDADEGSNTPVVAEEGSEVVREEGGAASPAADVADSEVIPAESIADSGAVEQHTSGASAEDKASTPTDVSADASQVEDESAAA